MIYLLIVNAVAVFVCFMDKYAARRRKWRVPEKYLFFFSAIGGSVGMYVAMRLIRHKTRHKRFMIGIPLMILLQIALVCYIQYLTK